MVIKATLWSIITLETARLAVIALETARGPIITLKTTRLAVIALETARGLVVAAGVVAARGRAIVGVA